MSNTTEKYSVITNAKLSNYTVEETTHQEKKTLVVPVVMIVEGVLNGSHGPLLHLAEDFGKIAESWNGIPVVINHPQQDGMSISANSPEVIESGLVGRVYNAHMDANRLLAEVWLDEEKLGNISADTLVAVNGKKPIEISVGVFTEDEPTVGDYNGVPYNAIARNHRPDHLALLPGGVGACSLEDGCGIRANQLNKKEGGVYEMITNENKNAILQDLRAMGYSLPQIGINMALGLKEKLDELYELVRSMNEVDGKGNTTSWGYLEEAYDTFLIYSIEGPSERKYYKSNYQFNVTTGEPEFVGDPIEVEKKVEFKVVPQVNNVLNTNKMEKCTPCIEKRVTELVANKQTKFTDADVEWLQTLTEAQLDQMIPEELEVVENAEVTALSAEDKAALEFGKKMLKKKKDDMAAGIQKNTEAGIWTPEILANMSEEMLERVYNSVKKEDTPVVADYSLAGNARAPQANSPVSKVEPMLPNI